tara:strand:- start:98 stop:511 length:414 start_codon:yes stop_codon:yes gene_type:complete
MRTIKSTLTFELDELKNLIEFEKEHTPNDLAKDIISIRLVGDEGVYFMPTHSTAQSVKSAETDLTWDDIPIVYANEANAKEMELDDWWEAKRRTWGGDDGATDIPLETLSHVLDNPKAEALSVRITPESIEFFAYHK